MYTLGNGAENGRNRWMNAFADRWVDDDESVVGRRWVFDGYIWVMAGVVR